MDYIEEESRPRFLFQSRSSSSNPNPNASTLPFSKLHFAACLSAALLLLFFTLSFPLNETLSFLLIWTALSLLAAPFAPSSLTGGHVHVGRGDPLPDPPASNPNPPDPDESRKRRAGSRKPDDGPPPIPAAVGSGSRDPVRNGRESVKEVAEEEKEWTDEDFDILKRQISKHPAGEPKRWERIAEVFKGRHGLESVIKTAKSLSERRPAAGDSFAQFLKQRKPLDKRAEVVDGELNGGIQKESDGGSVRWSGEEDIALLNALKAFPKEVSMRWEKIAAAVPGKSKAACMKRVAELKRDFRSSKG